MQDSSEITILIVDDSPEDREAIKRFLSKSRAFTYQILEAETGEKGFESLRKHIPDCILLDYKLPDIDGINFIKDMVGKHNLGDIPIVLLSGQGDETVATEALKSGAQDYLMKDNLNSDSLMRSIRYAAEKKQTEKTLRENEVKYRQIYNTTFDGIITADKEGKIIEVNQKAEEIFGYEKGEMVGLEIVKLIPEHFRENHLAGMKQFLKTGKGKILGTLIELQGLHKNDNIFPIELIVNSFTVAESTYLTGTMRDITERKQLEEKLEKLAITDSLTQVYNRLGFDGIINNEMERAKRYKQSLSVLMFDIDNFKEINDSYGHSIGDYILKTIVNIAKGSIREIDYLIRWGGEEFLIITPNTTLKKAKALAGRIRKAIECYRFDKTGSVTVSFGVTCFIKNDSEITLIKRVDNAMYQAKAKGRNKVVMNA